MGRPCPDHGPWQATDPMRGNAAITFSLKRRRLHPWEGRPRPNYSPQHIGDIATANATIGPRWASHNKRDHQPGLWGTLTVSHSYYYISST